MFESRVLTKATFTEVFDMGKLHNHLLERQCVTPMWVRNLPTPIKLNFIRVRPSGPAKPLTGAAET